MTSHALQSPAPEIRGTGRARAARRGLFSLRGRGRCLTHPLNATPSWAQDSSVLADRAQLSRVVAVDVQVLTSFTPPCGSHSARSLQTEVELILRRAGIPVAEQPYSFYEIQRATDLSADERLMAQLALPHWFSVNLVATGNGYVCTFAHNSQLYRREITAGGPAMSGFVHPFSTTIGVIIGPPEFVYEAIERRVREIANSLANEILKARGK